MMFRDARKEREARHRIGRINQHQFSIEAARPTLHPTLTTRRSK
jgi:hypothetical protein